MAAFCLTSTFFFALVLKVGTLTEAVDGSLTSQLRKTYGFDAIMVTVGMTASIASALVLAVVMAVYQISQAAAAEKRAAARLREAEAARGRMSAPPTCQWELPVGATYCIFLSHYKVEAGSDARYLSDLIRRMTGMPAFLDSVDLVDLRTLFDEGVHKTDVLVILATKGVFTRPWCLLEMWEAAKHQVPIVLFPVERGGFKLADVVTLLSDLAAEMPALNPTCLEEVMRHVGKQGVTDVREVEDVLLAHIGLVPSLERSGRPAAAVQQLNATLARHLRPSMRKTPPHRDTDSVGAWLKDHYATVAERLPCLSWQPWGTDNHIIASVQALMETCAAARGREKPAWQESISSPSFLASAASSDSEAAGRQERSRSTSSILTLLRTTSSNSGSPRVEEGHLLVVGALTECGGTARLLQQQLATQLGCAVILGTESVDAWRAEVAAASRGVVLVQTRSVLRHPVRLLQLFEAVQRRFPLVCVNIVSGGYEFEEVNSLLEDLPAALPERQMATLRAELSTAQMNELGQGLSEAVTNAMSVFFNPTAGSQLADAALKDILDKLNRRTLLLKAGGLQSQWDILRRDILRPGREVPAASVAVATDGSSSSDIEAAAAAPAVPETVELQAVSMELGGVREEAPDDESGARVCP